MGRGKKVLIDVNSVVPWFAAGKQSGIGRTTMELVRTLDAMRDDLPFQLELYSQNMKGIGARDLATGFRTHHLWLPKRDRFDKLINSLRIRDAVCRYDLMHIPHNFDFGARPDRCITTIHDAMFFTYPEEAFAPEFCRREYSRFARECRAVLTCSHSSKRDIVEYMNVPEERIFVAPWGCDTTLFKPTDAKAEKPFFLSTSCDLGRKNTISVICAFARYAAKSQEHDLVLVWRNPPAEIVEEIKELGISERVRFARNIPDDELAGLYATATATLFPSLYEGFGLPILESMACATPVVTCRNSSLEEVGGEAVIYVEPYDIEVMAEIMKRFEEMPEGDIERLRERSLAQSRNFSWRTCAKNTIEAYKQALANS